MGICMSIHEYMGIHAWAFMSLHGIATCIGIHRVVPIMLLILPIILSRNSLPIILKYNHRFNLKTCVICFNYVLISTQHKIITLIVQEKVLCSI